MQRQERVSLEHRGLAHVVPHPRQCQGLRRASCRPADPGLHERGDGQGRRAAAQAGHDLSLPRRFQRGSERTAQRRHVPPGAVPEVGGASLSPGQDRQGISGQAPQGRQHGVRRRPGLGLRHHDRRGRDGHPPRVPRPQGQGRRDQHRRGAGGVRVGAGALARRPALPRRADRIDPGQDPDRGEQGGRPGSAVRRRQRADLVPHHSVEQPGRICRGVPQEAQDRARRQALVRNCPGRGRAGRHRHGYRGRLGRRPR